MFGTWLVQAAVTCLVLPVAVADEFDALLPQKRAYCLSIYSDIYLMYKSCGQIINLITWKDGSGMAIKLLFDLCSLDNDLGNDIHQSEDSWMKLLIE